jgi:4'-phosphopantetheinyl transferase
MIDRIKSIQVSGASFQDYGSNDFLHQVPGTSRAEWTMRPDQAVWRSTLEQLVLTDTDVHVWQTTLDRPQPFIDRLLPTLSAEEQERANRFHFERDRRRFVVGRGVLRALIGRYLHLPAATVQFEYSEYGKPALASAMDEPDFQFNVSHSRALALFAFTRRRQIGVYVEFIRPLEDADDIAARFFSARESEVFRQLPAQQKQAAFFDCWTRKEAFIKAVGEGLSHPLDQFDVAFAPGRPARLLHVAGGENKADRWRLRALYPAPRYAAALVVEGHEWRLSCWQW